MKLRHLVLVGSALLATTAFAGPKVGDQARMEGVYVAEGMEAKVAIEKKVSAYDANTDVYAIDIVEIVGPTSTTSSENVSGEEMMSDEIANAILENCTLGIGSIERIEVKAGSFKTCHVSQDGSEIWIAPVPFGLVKIVTTEKSGQKVSLELATYSRAN